MGERVGDLVHGHFEQVVRVGEVIAGYREHAHAAPDQGENAKLLGYEVTGEPAGILDDNGAHTITLNPVQESRETRAGLNRVRTRHSRVVELVYDHKARPLGEGHGGVALALVAVLTRTDVGGT